MTIRIVKRAFSQYTTVISDFAGSYREASNYADKLQYENQDGEYFPRFDTDPDYIPSSSYQSGMDWL